MPDKGVKIFPDDVRTITFSTGKIRTTIIARIFFRDEATKTAVPGWACERVVSPEGIELKKNLFVDSHLVYNAEKQECLRILDWFPGLVDRNAAPAQEVLIPWEDVRAFTAQTKTEPA